jgi:hypothetical protein
VKLLRKGFAGAVVETGGANGRGVAGAASRVPGPGSERSPWPIP